MPKITFWYIKCRKTPVNRRFTISTCQ